METLGLLQCEPRIQGARALRCASALGLSGMSPAAGGLPGEAAAFFSGEAVEEAAALENREVVQYRKCSSCWWKTSLRRLK